eukprot:366097-Chlamydomonas_euryale.AAC.50
MSANALRHSTCSASTARPAPSAPPPPTPTHPGSAWVLLADLFRLNGKASPMASSHTHTYTHTHTLTQVLLLADLFRLNGEAAELGRELEKGNKKGRAKGGPIGHWDRRIVGTWEKVDELSDSQDAAADLLQLGGLPRKAVFLFKGEHSSTGARRGLWVQVVLEMEVVGIEDKQRWKTAVEDMRMKKCDGRRTVEDKRWETCNGRQTALLATFMRLLVWWLGPLHE